MGRAAVKVPLTGVGPASRGEPLIPGHRLGLSSIGAVRRVWCSCGWKWRQDDPAMPLDEARQKERQHVNAHHALARPPAAEPDGSDWCRERPG